MTKEERAIEFNRKWNAVYRHTVGLVDVGFLCSVFVDTQDPLTTFVDAAFTKDGVKYRLVFYILNDNLA